MHMLYGNGGGGGGCALLGYPLKSPVGDKFGTNRKGGTGRVGWVHSSNKKHMAAAMLGCRKGLVLNLCLQAYE